MLLSKTVVAAAIIASTQAADTGEGTFAGPGFVKYETSYYYDSLAIAHYGRFIMEFGVKDVTFTDNTDFEAESVWCLPNGITDKFYCAMATIVDPLGAKTLTFKVWKSVEKKTFTESESLATTLGTPEHTQDYTGNTVNPNVACEVTSTTNIFINKNEDSLTDATNFTIPIRISEYMSSADEYSAFEEGMAANFNEFWGATQVYTGTDGTRTTVQGDKEKLA